MSREIKFRGKCKRGFDYSDGSGWVYGSLLTNGKESGIVKDEDLSFESGCDDGIGSLNDFGFIPVEHESVGQFTGLHDRNGNPIYEGDLVRWDDMSNGEKWRVAVVELEPALQFRIVRINCDYIQSAKEGHVFKFGSFIYIDTHNHLEIIGNIHSDKEFLK